MNEPESLAARWPANLTPRQRRMILAWIVVVGLASLIRMFVVAQDGIVLLIFDSTLYAQNSVYYFDDAVFTRIPTHRPGLPILAWGTRQLGIPFKMFLDGLLMLTAVYAGLTLTRLLRSHAAGMLLYFGMMASPWFMAHSRLFVTEPLVALLMILLVLLAIQFICRPACRWSWVLALLAAVVSSVYVLTRNEMILIAPFWGMIIVCAALRGAWYRLPRLREAGWRSLLVIVPLVAAWLAIETVKRSHEHRFGVRCVCATEADGMSELMNALYSIPDDPPMRYAPVTRSTIERASRVSPTLARYQERLLDLNRGGYQFGREILGLKDEFGSWLNWHLVDSFGGINPGSNRAMQQAASEIRSAQAAGQLKWRFARYPIDPMWRAWLPDLPAQTGLALKRSFNRHLSRLDKYFISNRPRSSVGEGFFDDGLLRRSSIVLDRITRIYGQTPYRNTPITSVGLFAANSQPVLTVPVLMAPTGERYFSISLRDIESPLVDSTFYLQMMDRDGQTTRSPPIRLQSQMSDEVVAVELESDQEIPRVEYWAISASRSLPPRGPRQRIQRFLGRNHGYWNLLGILVAIIAGFRLRASKDLQRDIAWVTFVVAGFFILRCVMYSLIEVWLLWGLHRYVEPNIFVGLFGLACLGFLLGATAGRLFDRLRGQTAVTGG